jgi:hypothetical protein
VLLYSKQQDRRRTRNPLWTHSGSHRVEGGEQGAQGFVCAKSSSLGADNKFERSQTFVFAGTWSGAKSSADKFIKSVACIGPSVQIYVCALPTPWATFLHSRSKQKVSFLCYSDRIFVSQLAHFKWRMELKKTNSSTQKWIKFPSYLQLQFSLCFSHKLFSNNGNYFRMIYLFSLTMQLVESPINLCQGQTLGKVLGLKREWPLCQFILCAEGKGGGLASLPNCDHGDGGTETQELLVDESEKRSHPHNNYATEWRLVQKRSEKT